MDYKRNERFFKQNDMPRLIGAGLLVVGLLWFWLGRSALSYYGPCVMVPAGFLLFLAASSRNVPESEIRGVISRNLADLDADITQNEEWAGRILTVPAPYRGEAFAFDGEERMVRRGKDAKLLSGTYCATAVFVTRDVLLLRGRCLSLTEDGAEDVKLTLPRAEVGAIELMPFERRVRLTNQRNAQATVKGITLCLRNTKGESVYCAPVPDDMDAENLRAAIERWCEQGGKV